jgi:hypothetical protein
LAAAGSAAAALLLAACSADAPGPASDTSEPQAVPTEATIASPWPADYAAMRTAAAGWAADELATEAQAATRYEGPAPDSFDLVSCAEPDAEPAEQDRRTELMARLAHQAVLAEARLKAAGYSADVWADALETQQRAALDLVATEPPPSNSEGDMALFEKLMGLQAQAAATMELRRQALQPELPPIIGEGGCGAFETPFLVRADPPGGRIWLTTRFTFQTCQALGKSAWDTAQCRWTEVQPDQPSFLSGTYMVQARWPDGRTLRSSQRFQPDPTLETEEAVPITIRPG